MQPREIIWKGVWTLDHLLQKYSNVTPNLAEHATREKYVVIAVSDSDFVLKS